MPKPQSLLLDAHYAQSLSKSSSSPPKELHNIASTIAALSLQPHPEGGYFAETDRDPLLIPNPFLYTPSYPNATTTSDSATRNASTSIFYLLTPQSSVGHWHRNKARTVHTLHWGRGRYVLIHADEAAGDGSRKARVETFVVGHNLAKGERLQWIVEGGKFKASYLLPDSTEDGIGGAEGSSRGLLISETVVPGFEFADHDFLTAQGLKDLVEEDKKDDLVWLLNEREREKW